MINETILLQEKNTLNRTRKNSNQDCNFYEINKNEEKKFEKKSHLEFSHAFNYTAEITDYHAQSTASSALIDLER